VFSFYFAYRTGVFIFFEYLPSIMWLIFHWYSGT